MNYKNVYATLRADFSNIYRLENGDPEYVSQEEVEQAMKDGVAGRYYYAPRPLCFSDYSGTEVERSNARVFLEEFQDSPFVKFNLGYFGSEMILIDLLCTDEDIMKALEDLKRQGSMNQDDVDQLRATMIKEAWGDIKRDLVSGIEGKFNIKVITPEEVPLLALYSELQEKSDHYPIIECGGLVYVDIDLLLEHLHEVPSFLRA